MNFGDTHIPSIAHLLRASLSKTGFLGVKKFSIKSFKRFKESFKGIYSIG